MFERFWARQARVRVGLVENAYKTIEILTILQKHCSRCNAHLALLKRSIQRMQFYMVLTRPWRIGVGVIWPVVILRLKH